MKHGTTRRTAALALTAAVTVGGALLTAGPASAISRVGGIGCSTNGVTIFQANDVRYPYDYYLSQNRTVTIES